MNTIGNKMTNTSTRDVKSMRGTSAGVSTGGGGVSVTNGNAVRQTAQITGNMILAQMKPGSMFAGDIIDVRGNAIKLLLSGDKMLDASTADAKNLNIGDHITFNVASNNGTTVVIKPVKVNHVNTNVLLKALEAAEAPATDKNMEIVKSMMKHEMSIDKKSIMDMMRKVEAFKTDNPENIVSMEKHGIPLTQENVDQFAAYKNYEHRIMAQAETVAADIPQLLSEVMSSGDESKAVALAKELVAILDESPLYTKESDVNVVNDSNIASNTANGLNISNTSNVQESMPDVQNPVQMQAGEDISEMDVEYLKSMGLMENDAIYEPGQERIANRHPLTTEQVINNLETLQGEELKAFIDSDDFKTFVRDKVERSFELNVNKLGVDGEESKELVKKLYDNLEQKTEAILSALENAGEHESKLAQTTNNIKNNMQFMQDLNQMASYIQLPVKFNESKAHGDLYVFNRKKGMPIDKDVVTAFLHLDMDNLGATDIHVTMEKNSVTTKFALSDEESMRIVEENLPQLKERLEKRGYIATFTVETDMGVANDNPFDKVLETDKPQISIKRYSFDVRA